MRSDVLGLNGKNMSDSNKLRVSAPQKSDNLSDEDGFRIISKKITLKCAKIFYADLIPMNEHVQRNNNHFSMFQCLHY